MLNKPSVSVVIPTKGRPRLLVRAIESARNQTLVNIEIIIVVDGYDPLTEEVIDQINDHRVKKIVNMVSVGGAESRNIGVHNASADWIAFLDDDDEFLCTKLERQLSLAQGSTHRYPVIYCKIFGRTPAKDLVWPRREPRVGEHISDYILSRNSLFQGEGLIQTTMLFVPKELLVAVPFRNELKRHQEWDWAFRAAQMNGVGFELCNEILAVWYIEENRQGVSTQGNWVYSLHWIQSMKDLVAPRAYAAFLMTVVSSIAKKENDKKAFRQLWQEANRNGKPSVLEKILFLGIWATPQNFRHQLRNLWMGSR
ncbi:glycosyltransferase family 2 protein [Paenibacillus sp. Soil766]|uniref:glycosyltransferase family 2 protein n=1 Tax=Paenibacillus sp. Soil766 TaxID=1736404 RepID=UPI000B1912C2|nr:glycosyltransferase family A protein [Paenibacillus sp. Soil766]